MADVYFGAPQLEWNAKLVALYMQSGVSENVVAEEYGMFGGHTVRLLSVWYLPRGVYGLRTQDLLIGDFLDDDGLQNTCVALAEGVRVRDGLHVALAIPVPNAKRMRRMLHTHFLGMELYARLVRCDAANGQLRVLLPNDLQWRSVYHGNRHTNYDFDHTMLFTSFVPYMHSMRYFQLPGPVAPSAGPIGLRVRSVVGAPASGMHVCGAGHVACGIGGVIELEEAEPSVPQLLVLLGCVVAALVRLTPDTFTFMVDFILYMQHQYHETAENVCLRLQHLIDTSESSTYGLMKYVDAIIRHFRVGADYCVCGVPVWFPHALFEESDGRVAIFEGVLQMSRRTGDALALGCIALEYGADGDGASYMLHETLFAYIASEITLDRIGFLERVRGRDVGVSVYMIARSGVCNVFKYEVSGVDVVALYWDMMDRADAVMCDRLLVMRQPPLLPSSAEFQASVVGRYMRGEEGALEDASVRSVVAVSDIDVGSGGSVALRMCATRALVAQGPTTRSRMKAANRLYYWCYDRLPAVVVTAINNCVIQWLPTAPSTAASGHADENSNHGDDYGGHDVGEHSHAATLSPANGGQNELHLSPGGHGGVPTAPSTAASGHADENSDVDEHSHAATPSPANGGQNELHLSPGGHGGVPAAPITDGDLDDFDNVLAGGDQADVRDLGRLQRPPEPIPNGAVAGFPYVNEAGVRDMAYNSVARIQTYTNLDQFYIPDTATHSQLRHKVNGLVQAIAQKVFRAHKIGLQNTLHRELLRVCTLHHIVGGIEKLSDNVVRKRAPYDIIMRYTHMYFNMMVQIQHDAGFYMRAEAVKRFGPQSQRFLMSSEGLEAYLGVEGSLENPNDFWLRRLVRVFGCGDATEIAPWVTENATHAHFHPPSPEAVSGAQSSALGLFTPIVSPAATPAALPQLHLSGSVSPVQIPTTPLATDWVPPQFDFMANLGPPQVPPPVVAPVLPAAAAAAAHGLSPTFTMDGAALPDDPLVLAERLEDIANEGFGNN